ncbi:YgdB family protein [Musicola keenii]|uniref:YgdB family protein n=1 Tax=Musicola keenii TaxID=2884250 RepID=UPI0017824335|nr:YgdB family protein [Musicola keenii]
MPVNPQRGSTVLMAMLMLVIGMLILSGLQRQLEAQMLQDRDEQRALEDFNLASSALKWGLTLEWRIDDDGWQCQSAGVDALRACLRLNAGGRIGLLRGERLAAGVARPAAFYYRVVPALINDRPIIQPIAGGWLDVCPVAGAQNCGPAE